MRASPILLALPALAAAADQIPLVDQVKGWFSQATAVANSYIPQGQAPSFPNPIDAGAAAIARGVVEPITTENYNTVLKPGAATANPGLEEWMVLITGGNKSCFGMCQHAETEWNRSVPLLTASRNAPHLGMINCETSQPLCNAWATGPPTIVHMFLPQPLPDQSTPATTVRFVQVNRTSITAQEIAAIHTEEKYKETEPYEGFFHPFDGQLAKLGVAVPLGWVFYGFSKVPSWMFMIAVSFGSRTIM